ncbi:hypothetical protein ABPG73_017280 [Tetrahymena malaccensis]
MEYSKFDLFSTQFSFNIGNQIKKEEEKEFQEIRENDEISLSQCIPSFQNKLKKELDSKIPTLSIQNDQSKYLQSTLNSSIITNQQQSNVVNAEKKFVILDDLNFAQQESKILKLKTQDFQLNQESFSQLRCQSLQKNKIKENNNLNIKTLNSKENNTIQKKSHWYQQQFKQAFSQEDISQKENLSKLQQHIQDMQKMSLSNKILNNILGQKICKSRRDKEKKLNSQKQLKTIEKYILSELNILNFFQDIIFLKKAIMLLLTQDQLAVLKLVGLSSSILDLDLQNIEDNFDQHENSLSHYEKQFLLLKSQKLQQRYMDKFLMRCSNRSNNLSEFDNTILAQLKYHYINK